MNNATLTASASLGTVGGGAVILWIVNCLHAGSVVTPDAQTCEIMAGLLAPIFHMIYNKITKSGSPS